MKGLSSFEVQSRIDNKMVNNEIIKNSRSINSIFLSNILTLFNFIHVILFVLVLTTGALNNAMFIIAILVNTSISIYQEIKAKKIIDSLVITKTLKTKVLRNGLITKILPSEIVMDDILYLKAGDSLVVDAEIIKSNELEVDESIITGESLAVLKNKGEMLISGSVIMCGDAYAKVISINKNTYANNLIKDATVACGSNNTSYLIKSINSILKVVTFLIVPIGILLFITQFFYSGQTYSESILSSVAGIIGMIPDGLFLLTSISLMVGVIKMSSKKVIVQKLSGVELLACVDILCLDKTGTITDGSMNVVDVLKMDKEIDMENVVANMLLDVVNATDISLSKYFKKKQSMKIIKKIPFSSSRKYSLVKFENGTYALGALEYLTNYTFDEFDVLDKYVKCGYRIITLVKCVGSFNKNNNKIIGFIILKDNVRKNAKKILEYFNEQNVNIKIISGDNPKTISNLLKQISFDLSDKYISGVELPDNYDDLKKIVNKYNIYGRVTPQQKRNIIKALKENATVGMVGDGVNDILALKEADCGIALANGISAARSVSEIILTESDFSVLSDIVNEGRRVVNNIERVSSMYLVKTVYSFCLSIICILLSYEYPFYPIQLTLISVICVGIPSFFLALEPNYMKVKLGFLKKVFRNALPSGLCVCLNVFILIIFSYISEINFDSLRFTVVFITGYINLRLLYKISCPLSLFRKILLLFCSISFISFLLLFRNFFLLNAFNYISICYILIFICIDHYIINFFLKIYDKIVLWIEKNQKEKRICEK